MRRTTIRLLALFPLLQACALESPADPTLTWEEFLEQTPRHKVYPDVWLVEGDIRIHGEDELYAYWEARYSSSAEFRSVTMQYDDGTRMWNPAEKFALTYCINTPEMDAAADDIHDWMTRATRDWEGAGDVNFIHRPELDGPGCTEGSGGVVFAVRAVPEGNCEGNAFFPNEGSPSERVLWMEGPNTCTDDEALRTLRHELGHILGFQHEHFHPEYQAGQPTCSGLGGDLGVLAEYDPYSVMTYVACVGGPKVYVSRRDHASATFLYDLPSHRSLVTSRGRVERRWSSYFDNGRTDIFWFDPEGPDQFMYGLPQGVARISSDDEVPSTETRPFPGRFDEDFLTDVFYLDEGPEEDGVMAKNAANGWSFHASDVADPMHEVAGSESDALMMPLTGRFAGDGSSDVIWYGPGNAEDSMWVGPLAFVEHELDAGTATDYLVPAVGDFDGDSDDDVFFYNSDHEGASLLMLSNGDGTWQQNSVDHTQWGVDGAANSRYSWTMRTGDFNADGYIDLMFYTPTIYGGAPTQNVVFVRGGLRGFGRSSSTSKPGRDLVFTGDFDGNGATDIFFYNQLVGAVGGDEEWRMPGGGFVPVVHVRNVSSRELRPVLGDFNGDMRTDIYWWNSIGVDQLWRAGQGDMWWLDPVNDDFTGYPVGYGLSGG